MIKNLFTLTLITLLAACHHQVQPQETEYVAATSSQMRLDLDSSMATLDMAEFAFRR